MLQAGLAAAAVGAMGTVMAWNDGASAVLGGTAARILKL
jgi:hypothetical protein